MGPVEAEKGTERLWDVDADEFRATVIERRPRGWKVYTPKFDEDLERRGWHEVRPQIPLGKLAERLGQYLYPLSRRYEVRGARDAVVPIEQALALLGPGLTDLHGNDPTEVYINGRLVTFHRSSWN